MVSAPLILVTSWPLCCSDFPPSLGVLIQVCRARLMDLEDPEGLCPVQLGPSCWSGSADCPLAHTLLSGLLGIRFCASFKKRQNNRTASTFAVDASGALGTGSPSFLAAFRETHCPVQGHTARKGAKPVLRGLPPSSA